MAVFGIPELHEDDALRAVRAAAEIRDAARGAERRARGGPRGRASAFRTGVNTGEVVAGDPGSGTTLVTGDTVNTAARLEQAAPPGEILSASVTYTLVRDAVEVEAVEPDRAKGKAEPVAAYRLLAVRAGAEGRARRLDAPLVGRERELGRLRAGVRQAVDDRACQLFTVLGLAGVGKSRLVARVPRRGVGAEAAVLRGRCLSYGEGITFWPIARDRPRGGRDRRGRRRPRRRARRCAALFGDAPDGDALAERRRRRPRPVDEQARTRSSFWAVRRLFEALAAERPLVVVVEDIHWAEPTMLDLARARRRLVSRRAAACSYARRDRSCSTARRPGAAAS